MIPPITGPRIGASIAGIETIPITRPILRGPATWAMISWPTGMIMPPPAPCRILKNTRLVTDAATAHSAEPAVKRTSEVMYTRLAPKRREAHPVTGITAASASR